MRACLTAVLCWLVVVPLLPAHARAADLPRAAESPLSGLVFDDKPITLPLARNFEIAMTAVSRELGRSCSAVESYGWRLGAGEQGRVNQIFAQTVDRLRALGYAVKPQAPRSVSSDVTVFTAARPDRDLMFVWSAGELGLVLLVCDAQPPAPAKDKAVKAAGGKKGALTAATVPLPEAKEKAAKKDFVDPYPKFSPKGRWIGGYSCAQGYTGGTLTISSVSGESFKGVFRFYPTPQNQSVPAGSYYVSGQYDKETKRILIEPGAWIHHPDDFYTAIMIGTFNPERKKFSGVFQGVNGCTSFEAKYSDGNVAAELDKAKGKKAAKKKAKKTAFKKKTEKAAAAEETDNGEKAPAGKAKSEAAPNDAIRLDEAGEADLPKPPDELPEPPDAPGVETGKPAAAPAPEPAAEPAPKVEEKVETKVEVKTPEKVKPEPAEAAAPAPEKAAAPQEDTIPLPFMLPAAPDETPPATEAAPEENKAESKPQTDALPGAEPPPAKE